MNIRFLLPTLLFCTTLHAMERTVPALFAAARDGNLFIVEQLTNYETVNSPASNFGDATPLHVAAENGHLEVVRLLLQYNADINAKSSTGSTPLYIAAQQGHLEVVRLLLEYNPDVNAQRSDGVTPLYIAAQNGHLEVVHLLLQNKADINAKNSNGATPLFIAAQTGHLEVVRLLLQNNADINAKCSNGVTPLHVAVHQGHLEVVKQLVIQGADVNAKLNAPDSRPPADLASPDLSHYLRVTLPATFPHTLNLLLSAASTTLIAPQTHKQWIIDAIAHGAEINASRLPGGNTALHFAVYAGNIPMTKYLITHGADINTRNIDGDTLLHIATRQQNRAMIFVLLANGANPSIENYEHETPVHLATISKDILKIFLLAMAKEKKDADALRAKFCERH